MTTIASLVYHYSEVIVVSHAGRLRGREAEALDLFRNGMAIRAIADYFGVTYGAIQYHLLKAGLVAPAQTILPRQLSTTEAAYIAGIIDGEGYIGLQFNRWKAHGKEYAQGEVCVCMTDKPTIDYIHTTTGIGHVYTHDHPSRKNSNWKVQYRWRSNGIASAGLIRQVRPYMVTKAEQADLYLEFFDLEAQCGRGKIGNPRTGLRPPEIVERCIEIDRQLKALKHMGVVVVESSSDTISHALESVTG